MIRQLFAYVFALCVVAPLVQAEAVPERVAPLVAELRLDELGEILTEEGLSYGRALGTDFLPGRDQGAWMQAVGRIYETGRITQTLGKSLNDGLGKDALDEVMAFIGSDEGRRLISLELDVRRAFLDHSIEEAARAEFRTRAEQGDDRLALVTRFIEANDLIESNVAGGLTSNAAFFLALLDGGTPGMQLTTDQILRDVAGQEDDIRADTTEWVSAYLLLAYGPLSDAELEAYIAFSETDAGQAFNAAYFAGFDTLFAEISRALGLALAQQLSAQEL
ncbi:MAG: hypothetical protein AAF330_07635 [Pseudomonadota bacterium]